MSALAHLRCVICRDAWCVRPPTVDIITLPDYTTNVMFDCANCGPTQTDDLPAETIAALLKAGAVPFDWTHVPVAHLCTLAQAANLARLPRSLSVVLRNALEDILKRPVEFQVADR